MNAENGQRNFRCTICSKTSSSKYNVNRHIILIHTKPTKETCEICGKVFRNRFYKENHMRAKTCLKKAVFIPV